MGFTIFSAFRRSFKLHLICLTVKVKGCEWLKKLMKPTPTNLFLKASLHPDLLYCSFILYSEVDMDSRSRDGCNSPIHTIIDTLLFKIHTLHKVGTNLPRDYWDPTQYIT